MKTNTPETDLEVRLLDISCDDSCCAIYLEKNKVPVLGAVGTIDIVSLWYDGTNYYGSAQQAFA